VQKLPISKISFSFNFIPIDLPIEEKDLTELFKKGSTMFTLTEEVSALNFSLLRVQNDNSIASLYIKPGVAGIENFIPSIGFEMELKRMEEFFKYYFLINNIKMISSCQIDIESSCQATFTGSIRNLIKGTNLIFPEGYLFRELKRKSHLKLGVKLSFSISKTFYKIYVEPHPKNGNLNLVRFSSKSDNPFPMERAMKEIKEQIDFFAKHIPPILP